MCILTQAANILDTSEFKVLEYAYQHWFGEQASFEFIERIFSDYLHSQTSPYWARHYAANIINRFETEKQAQRNFYHCFSMLFWNFKQQIPQENHILVA